MNPPRWPAELAAVIFDIDGTLLDSAPGIVAGFRHALTSVGFAAPSDEMLGSDLGPPVGDYFTALGLRDDRLLEAVTAYRAFYLAHGRHQAVAYAGVVDLLVALTEAGVPLGTATAKRTDVAGAILRAHDLEGFFAVINGTDETRTTKSETVAHTLELLGSPDPDQVVMVGDRHSDVTGGRACGVFTVGAAWGYGSVDELAEAGADVVVGSAAELLAALTLRNPTR